MSRSRRSRRYSTVTVTVDVDVEIDTVLQELSDDDVREEAELRGLSIAVASFGLRPSDFRERLEVIAHEIRMGRNRYALNLVETEIEEMLAIERRKSADEQLAAYTELMAAKRPEASP